MASARDKVERDNRIIRMKMRGLSTAWVAAKEGVSETTVDDAYREYRENNPTLRHHDPVEIVDQLLYQLDGMKEHLAEEANEATLSGERLQAISQRRQVLHDIAALLQSTGTLPKNLGDLRLITDADLVARQIGRVLDAFDASPEMITAMRVAIAGGRPELPSG